MCIYLPEFLRIPCVFVLLLFLIMTGNWVIREMENKQNAQTLVIQFQIYEIILHCWLRCVFCI